MNIGNLRHRITIQTLQPIKNNYGEVTNDWVDFKTVWANINPVSGREFFSAETVNSEMTHKVLIRFVKDIKPKMRVKFGDRFFNIETIINFQERNQYLQLMCKELIK